MQSGIKCNKFVRTLRVIAYALVVCLVVECAPAGAMADAVKDLGIGSKRILERIQSDVRDAQSLQALQRLDAMIPKVDMAAFSKKNLPPLTGTMVDEVGRMARPVNPAVVVSWKHQIAAIGPRRSAALCARLAKLHVWVGEYELGHDRQPEEANLHFVAAQHLTAPSERWHGLAAYDSALALFHMGAYADADNAFRALLKRSRAMTGFPIGNCALVERHANACAAYHAERAAMGITEPPQLDPLCGVAGLGAALRTLHRNYDERTVLNACPVTGEGSTFKDLVNGAERLDLRMHVVNADSRGLRLLPKPLIAYVERDHFITVTSASDAGVDYLCIDCGMWPGMHRHLSWSQWSAMAPGEYGVIVPPGGPWDRALTQAPKELSVRLESARVGIRVASASPVTGLGVAIEAMRLLNLIKGHVVQVGDPGNAGCGQIPPGNKCSSFISCLLDSPGGGGAGGSTCTAPGGSGGSGQAHSGGHANHYSAAAGASAGDPVNLATGEEEYRPGPDLIVYNPHGPSITWSRMYDSMRTAWDSSYEFDDYGMGWSQTYNVGVYDPTNGDVGVRYILEPNGARDSFTANTIPTLANPVVPCVPEAGAPFTAEWDFNAATGALYYKITWASRTEWVTTPMNGASLCSALDRIVDRNGHAIHFNYGAPASASDGWTHAWPLLASITNDDGAALLVVTRVADGSGRIAAVSDCYGRSIYYHSAKYFNNNLPWYIPPAYEECDHVSQVTETGTQPVDRYSYGYQLLGNLDYSEQVNFLHTITVPSPVGSGTTTATINYDPNTDEVANIVDGNGNTRAYSSVDSAGNLSYPSNYTKVEVTDAAGNLAYSYVAGYDNNMSGVSITNGDGQLQYSCIYSDPNDPYRPSAVTDGNAHRTTYAWDPYGNMTASTDARGVSSAYTWAYTNFQLGELISIQDNSRTGQAKTATTFTYAEPSGLPVQVSTPAPGTAGTGATVATSLTYDGYGNVLTVTTPGNGTVSSETTTFDYGASDNIDEPISVTDNLGHALRFSYDQRANPTAAEDALGNFYTTTYNLADQEIESTLPATGQTGSACAIQSSTYQYPGGPLDAVTIYDESGNQARQTIYTYGQEGEILSESGSAEPVTYSYDAEYRLRDLTDGNGNLTQYSYNSAGYLLRVVYPGASDTTGPDTVNYTSYDAIGDVLSRTDGRGVTTSFAYADPDNNLTSVDYSSPYASLNVALTYDSFGRRASMTDSTGVKTYAYDDNDADIAETTTYTGLAGKTIAYAFYPDGSRSSMITPAGTFTYGYDGAGRMTGLTDPFGNTGNWSYYNNDWLAGQTLGNGSSTVANTTYSYNALGEQTDLLNQSSAGATLSEFGNFGYDGSLNLKSVTASIPAAPACSGTTTFSYEDNPAHNAQDRLTGESSTRLGGYSQTHAYDAAGNPTTFRNAAGLGYNVDNQRTSNSYDGNGAPTTYAGAAAAYDPENRLTQFGSAMSAAYNGDGLRASKTNAAGATYYLYDGAVPVCELNASGAVTAVNVFGANGLISRTCPGASGARFYTFDQQGSVAQRLNASGAVTSTDAYDAWGGRSSTGSGRDVFGYNAQWGYYTDAETGLILCTNRYYDPAQGRWLTRDPIGYAGGVNLYGYCGDGPAGWADPSGLDPPANPSGSDDDSGIDWSHLGMKSAHPGFNANNPTRRGMVSAAHAAFWAAILNMLGMDGGGEEADFAAGRLLGHYAKHGHEFPELASSAAYLRRAKEIVTGKAPGFVRHVTTTGDTYYYNAVTNEFAVLGKNNVIRTLFRPKNGPAYWESQCVK